SVCTRIDGTGGLPDTSDWVPIALHRDGRCGLGGQSDDVCRRARAYRHWIHCRPIRPETRGLRQLYRADAWDRDFGDSDSARAACLPVDGSTGGAHCYLARDSAMPEGGPRHRLDIVALFRRCLWRFRQRGSAMPAANTFAAAGLTASAKIFGKKDTAGARWIA